MSLGRAGARSLVLASALGVGCARVPPEPIAQAWLFEKGPYQAIYAPDGRILRLLFDRDGDRVADVITVYGPGARALQAELDTDGDRAVDRWEVYGDGGRLVEVGSARRTPGHADLWEALDERGRVLARRLDDDGDGRSEREESFDATGLRRVALDSDADGRVDRWQAWHERRVVHEDLDTDGDGEPDRRLRFGARGEVLELVKLGVPRAR